MTEPNPNPVPVEPLSVEEIAEWSATIDKHAPKWASTQEDRRAAIRFSRRLLATFDRLTAELAAAREEVAGHSLYRKEMQRQIERSTLEQHGELAVARKLRAMHHRRYLKVRAERDALLAKVSEEKLGELAGALTDAGFRNGFTSSNFIPILRDHFNAGRKG